MADPQDRPDEGAEAMPCAARTATAARSKKTRPRPPKTARPGRAGPEDGEEAPAKKTAPAKKAPPPALEPAAEYPALAAPAPHAALSAGNGSPPSAQAAAREAAAKAKSTVDHAADAVGGPLPATVSDSGRSPLPFAVAFAVTVLLALLIRRLRRHDDE